MSSRKTSEIRSHRSKRAYKPINKAMRHKEAARRKRVRHFVETAAKGKSIFDKLLG